MASYSPFAGLPNPAAQNVLRATSFGNSPKKRKVDEFKVDDSKENKFVLSTQMLTRNFLRIPANDGIYQSEEWKCKQTLFHPNSEDLMVNVRNIEQISSASGSYFIADENGVYSGNKDGQVINLWRYSEQERKLYVSRSFFISNEEVYRYVIKQLEEI